MLSDLIAALEDREACFEEEGIAEFALDASFSGAAPLDTAGSTAGGGGTRKGG